MSDEVPETDDRDPAHLVEASVVHALQLARTWTLWDGRPILADDRIYTPHKAIRRIADHLVDHLAELEARLAGQAPLVDRWHHSAITTPADLALFTDEDLDEATSRLTRLAQIWRIRLNSIDDERRDRVEDSAWTLRQVTFHVSSTYYADAVGDLGVRVS
ncbi:hypothetical protein [Kineosporia sp. NBRC 101731]|uniref:hypothetical protein n=1 Tax=Kineosporia sp. NBRC 101731 TaxID=3032199 RepID=UPI0024A5806F|nr:hypothetical protein [Kineosporia sp. NBRC 101731]GLY33839.1 hypothetical protein Kisp02_72040 [Kineosporia sp. NBRC 101731]